MLSILIAYLCLLTLSCADSPNNTGTKQKPVVVKKQPLKICLYRYHNFSISKAMYLKEELQRVYPAIELMPEPIQLPKQYYYAPRNRYSGRGLLRDLSQYKQSTVVLGLTNEVIYEPNENHQLSGFLASVQSVATLPSSHLYFHQGKSTVMSIWLS